MKRLLALCFIFLPVILNSQVYVIGGNDTIYYDGEYPTGVIPFGKVYVQSWAYGNPSSLTASVILDTQLNLAWVDGVTGEDGFAIERSTDSISFTVIDSAAANATTFSSTGLTKSTKYYYRIRAYKDVSYSPYAKANGKYTYDAVTFTSVQPASLNQVSIIFRTLTTLDTLYINWGEDAVVKIVGI